MALVFLFVQTPLHELCKLPVLIAHFQEHQQKDASLNLTQFLEMHYAGPDKPDADHNKDMQLPFKDHHDHVCSFVFVCLDCISFKIENTVFFDKNYAPSQQKDHVSPYLGNIFQPPRVC